MIRIGAQGWTYEDWIGTVYPEGTHQSDYLRIYSRTFDTVEVDSTFYAIPAVRVVEGWASKVPENFVFSPKLPNEITHIRRLHDADGMLFEFVSAVRHLGAGLGVILIQLPPDFPVTQTDTLAAFLPKLPTDLRFAIEFRDPAWLTPRTSDLLAEFNVALALTDGPWLTRDAALAGCRAPTADFHYVRWMGENRALGRFTHVQIDRSRENAEWVAALSESGVQDIFGYVNNQYSGHAPTTMLELRGAFGLPARPLRDAWEQTSLF